MIFLVLDNLHRVLILFYLEQQDVVKNVVDEGKLQNTMFRKLEDEDRRKKDSIQEQLENRTNLTAINKQKII